MQKSVPMIPNDTIQMYFAHNLQQEQKKKCLCFTRFSPNAGEIVLSQTS